MIEPVARKKRFGYMEQAAKAAKKSSMTHKHGCVLVLDNVGPIACGFNRIEKYLCHSFSIHAEVDAINKAKKILTKSQFQLTDLYVVRISKDSTLKLSKPCKHCQCLIMEAKIRNVFYSV